MGRFEKASLTKRVASALVLIPLTLGIIWSGGYFVMAFCLIGAALCLYEWRMLVKAMPQSALLLLLGGLYICGSGLSFYLLREHYPFRFTMALFTLVWVSDSAAYFAGKFIGGPKMAPKISPNKTWAGFGGAVLGPAIAAMIWAPYLMQDLPRSLHLFETLIGCFIVGLLVGTIGQAGDLIISHFKRRSGVKDTGNLIPGHGGLLDRVDSLIPNIPVFYLIVLGVHYAVS